jgi:hypothetical protein
VDHLSLFSFRFLIILAVGLSTTTRSSAQSDSARAAARATATEGISAYKKHDYQRSLDLLRRAEAAYHAPTHLLYIARAQAKLGQLVESAESYQRVIVENLSNNAPVAFVEAKVSAQKERPPIEARLAHLTIEVEGLGEDEWSQVEVLIDDQKVGAAVIGMSLPINPGPHEISLSAPGKEKVDDSVSLDEGQHASLRLVLVPSAEALQAAKEVDDQAADSNEINASDEKPGKARKIAAWATVGFGAAALATGAVFGTLSLLQINKAKKDDSLCGQNRDCTPDGWTEKKQAQTKALIADISLGVGVAAVAEGTVLLLTGKKSSEKPVTRFELIPTFGSHGGSLHMKGSF